MKLVSAVALTMMLGVALASSVQARGGGSHGGGSHAGSSHTSGAHHGGTHHQSDHHKRSHAAKDEFQRQRPCPSTGATSGGCKGYVIDHITPLSKGGADAPSNMQWQTIEEGKAKDKWERK